MGQASITSTLQTQPAHGDIIQGFSIGGFLKAAMKSTIYTIIAGATALTATVCGITSGSAAITTGTIVAIINFLSIIVTWIKNTRFANENQSFNEKVGNIAVGSVMGAAGTACGVLSAVSESDLSIVITGAITELLALIAAGMGLSQVWGKTDNVSKQKKPKYIADIIASVFGSIAYFVSLSSMVGGIVFFAIELLIRLLRLIYSMINTFKNSSPDTTQPQAEGEVQVQVQEPVQGQGQGQG